MKGLIFQPSGPVYVDESALIPIVINRTDFHKLFSVLYEDLIKFRWLIKGGYLHFNFPEEWVENSWYDEEQDLERSEQLDEYEAIIIKSGPNYTFTEPEFVPSYFRYFSDDWIDIFGLDKAFDNPNGFYKTYWSFKKGAMRNVWLAETVELYISNTDGMYWSFYSKHENLLQKMESHVNQLPEFKVIPDSLLDKKF